MTLPGNANRIRLRGYYDAHDGGGARKEIQFRYTATTLTDAAAFTDIDAERRRVVPDKVTGLWFVDVYATNDPDLTPCALQVRRPGERPFLVEVPFDAPVVDVGGGDMRQAVWLQQCALVDPSALPAPRDAYYTRVQTDAAIEGHNTSGTAHQDIRGLITAAVAGVPEQARDAVGAALVQGANVTITVDDAANTITIAATVPAAYTDEQAQDAFAALIAAGTHAGISFVYNDAGNALSATVAAQSWSQITGKPTTFAPSNDPGPLEGMNYQFWGHSYHDTGATAVTGAGGPFCARIASRKRMTPVSQALDGISLVGASSGLIRLALLGWTPNTRGLVSLCCTVNDAGAAATAPLLRSYEHAVRTFLTVTRSQARVAAASAAFVYSAGWTSSSTSALLSTNRFQTATVGSYAEVKVTGSACDLLLTLRAAGNGTYSITSDGATVATVTAMDATMGYDYVPAVIPLTGLGSGTHTIRITLTSGTWLGLDGLYIPSPTPPPVVLVGEGPIPGVGRDTLGTGYLPVMASVAAEFSNAIYVSMASAGWDPTTMLGADGIHPNDRGHSFMATTILDALGTVAWRNGLNVLANQLTYTPPSVPSIPSGGQDGTGAGPAVPTVVNTANTVYTPGSSTVPVTVTMPGSIVAGRLLLSQVYTSSTDTITPSAGWVLVGTTNQAALGWRYLTYAKIAAGSDTLTLTFGSASATYVAAITDQISGWSGVLSDLRYAGTDATLDPPSVTMGAATGKLWIVGCFNAGAVTAPTSYGSLVSQLVNVDPFYLNRATRTRTAATEDPGVFGGTASYATSWTVGIA